MEIRGEADFRHLGPSGTGAELSASFLLPMTLSMFSFSMTMIVKDKAASLRLFGVPLWASLPQAGVCDKAFTA